VNHLFTDVCCVGCCEASSLIFLSFLDSLEDLNWPIMILSFSIMVWY